jgi:hypothetical protein
MEITALFSQHVPKFFLVIAICAAASFAGCDRKTTSPAAEPPEAPLEQQTEQKLDPLTKDDVELYLKVMRAAAKRVRAPAPSDKAALDGARKILAARGSGRVPTQDDVKTLERANLVAISMDQIVAEELRLDGHTYRGIAEAIEAVIPNTAPGVAPGKGVVPVPDHTLTPLEKRLSDVNAANEKFLMAYREEIQKLVATVRNPANLPL